MESYFKKQIKTFILTIMVAFIIMIKFSFFIVSGESMKPTINENEYLVVEKNIFKEKNYFYKDIIVCKSDIELINGRKKELVKRIIACEGETIQITDGKVFINNEVLNEKYLPNPETQGEILMKVPKNYYFIMGDNRKNSIDSRDSSIGLIHKKNIVGKVWLKMFPVKLMQKE